MEVKEDLQGREPQRQEGIGRDGRLRIDEKWWRWDEEKGRVMEERAKGSRNEQEKEKEQGDGKDRNAMGKG